MMKKYFSNIFALAALLMAGAAFTACSSDDNIEQPANPAGEKTYTLTINASKGANASTRALALDGVKLVASWENGDVLTVFNVKKNAALTGSLTASNASGSTATFSGALTGTIEKDDELTLSYHQPTGIDDYKAQTGTLESAAARDYAVATVTVASVEGGEITINETSASFQTQTAMLKLTLQDNAKPTSNPLNATQLKVSAAMTIEIFGMSFPMTEDIATFNLAAATYTANGDGILYFALPDQATLVEPLVTKIKAKVPSSLQSLVTTNAVKTALDGATLTYTATVGDDTYTATKDKGYKFAAGKYYAGTLTMAKPAATTVTWNLSKVSGISINDDPEENSFESDGITVAAFGDSGANFENSKMSVGGSNSYFTFTSSVGNIKKIEINYTGDAHWDEPSDGWSLGDGTFTWEGDPATSVTLPSSGYAGIEGITSIVFTLE